MSHFTFQAGLAFKIFLHSEEWSLLFKEIAFSAPQKDNNLCHLQRAQDERNSQHGIEMD